MREIKFRGLDLEHDFWVYGSLINYDPIPEIQSTEIGEMDYDYPSSEVKPESVGQFTGLKDKNGVEIYEGDIVSGVTFQDGKPTKPTHGLPVTFENGCFMWSNEFIGWDLDDEESRVFTPCNTNTWAVVVGNIYEHPELVKIKK